MMQLFRLYSRGLIIFLGIFYPVVSYGQVDTVFFTQTAEIGAVTNDNTLKVDGLGKYDLQGFDIDLSLSRFKEYASISVAYNSACVLIDSVLSISELVYSRMSDYQILSFVAYTDVEDQKSRGRLYSIIYKGEELIINSIRVDNASPPVILNNSISVIESLRLMTYSIDLKEVINSIVIIHLDHMKKKYSYLDTYAVSDFKVSNDMIMIEFSKDAFNDPYYWYSGDGRKLLRGQSLIVLSN